MNDVPPEVVLRDYPVALGLAVSEHVEDWMREFRLIALGHSSGNVGHEVPDRLLQMVRHLSRNYATELSRPERVRADAAARGTRSIDLAYPVRPGTLSTVRGWQEMLAEVDHYCAAQDLLTLQREPELVALSDWVCEEFLRQLDGEPPRPWPEVAEQKLQAARAARTARS